MLTRVGTVAVSAVLVIATATSALATDTVGIVDPANGLWTLRAENGNVTTIGYGVPGDVPVMGDWDCDGVDTPGLYRRSDGFAYLHNSNTTGVADITFLFGIPGDWPLAGDFDGDGCDTLSIYRPSQARFYIINQLGANGGGLGNADYSYEFGVPGDVAVAGDWNGDGIDTPGLRRATNGYAYLRNSNTTGIADIAFFYGIDGDRPVAGDWDGDGRDTLGLFRSANRDFYLRNTNSTGIADSFFSLGEVVGTPVGGDFGLVLPAPPPTLALKTVATGLDRPLLVAAPVGDERLFVVEQTGDIEVFVAGVKQPVPFLHLVVTVSSEKGLLGLAFHPDYANNGKFYVNYTIGSVTRVSEFRVSSANPDQADATSERMLLEISQPHSNHNGGMVLFDANGFLLVALGDGGGAGDPGGLAQNPDSLLGKILRIDVDTAEGGKPYGIPTLNPFGRGGGAPEVFMVGLRNPWRVAVDGQWLYLADVGQGSREEITILPVQAGGANMGWDAWEGSQCFDGPCAIGGFTFPQIEYTHADGCSVTGGFVYRGTQIPGLSGTYFYGDYCGGWIRSLRFENRVAGSRFDRTSEFGSIPQLSSFGFDGAGELYVTSLQGSVSKIVVKP